MVAKLFHWANSWKENLLNSQHLGVPPPHKQKKHWHQVTHFLFHRRWRDQCWYYCVFFKLGPARKHWSSPYVRWPLFPVLSTWNACWGWGADSNGELEFQRDADGQREWGEKNAPPKTRCKKIDCKKKPELETKDVPNDRRQLFMPSMISDLKNWEFHQMYSSCDQKVSLMRSGTESEKPA